MYNILSHSYTFSIKYIFIILYTLYIFLSPISHFITHLSIHTLYIIILHQDRYTLIVTHSILNIFSIIHYYLLYYKSYTTIYYKYIHYYILYYKHRTYFQSYTTIYYIINHTLLSIINTYTTIYYIINTEHIFNKEREDIFNKERRRFYKERRRFYKERRRFYKERRYIQQREKTFLYRIYIN